MHVQAFVVAGGGDDMGISISSVLTLLPGATAWIRLARLPRALISAQASIVGGRLRLTGGRDEGDIHRSEVILPQTTYF